MKVEKLHGFDLSPAEARRLQGELASRVVAGPPLDLGGVRYVAGADVSTQEGMAYATVAVLDFPGLSVVEVRGFEAPLEFPYVPGLLSFREMPSVLGALEKVETAVDVMILDAQGLAHPRRMGLASHIGLFLDVPTVGCARPCSSASSRNRDRRRAAPRTWCTAGRSWGGSSGRGIGFRRSTSPWVTGSTWTAPSSSSLLAARNIVYRSPRVRPTTRPTGCAAAR